MTKGLCAVAIAAAGLTLASCSSDEPTGKDDGDVILFNGTRLVKLNNYDLIYDSNGRFVYAKEHNYDYTPEVTIDYANGKINFENGDFGYIEFNKSGYISAIRTSKNEGDGYEVPKTSSCHISYDSNGHILSTKRIDDYAGYRNGSAWTRKRTDNTTYNWESDNLISIEWSSSIIDNGQEEIEQNKSIVKISYSNMANSSRQYPFAIAHKLRILGYTDILSMVGLFGKGPAYLPESVSGKWNDNPEWDTTTLKYKLNDNGTIATESLTYSDDDHSDNDYKETFNYTYEKGK